MDYMDLITAAAGQITISGVTQGTDIDNSGGFYLKAHPDNSDVIWVGRDVATGVLTTTGFPLEPGEILPVSVKNLSKLYFNADVANEKVCWIKS